MVHLLMKVFLIIYFYGGIQRSWLSEKQVYVTASPSELPYVTAFAGLGRFLTHPRLLQVSGSFSLLLPVLDEGSVSRADCTHRRLLSTSGSLVLIYPSQHQIPML